MGAYATSTSNSTGNWTQSLAKLGIATLAANLTQYTTNGNSLYGTSHAPTFPKFLTNNPLPYGYPWGTKTAGNCNEYTQSPLTGVTRYYDFTVSRMDLAPDGVNRSMIVVNKQFPGPTIEANWGDWIQVTVKNELDNEGTAIHWHGLLQTDTPYYDGVPGVDQCPIAPGKSFTYRFKADLYGTSWYHAHYSAQYNAGAVGPMIIHGPNHLDKKQDYDIDLGPVMLSDWYHRDYYSIVKQVMGTDLPTIIAAGVSDNNLINGKMNYNCSLVPSNTSCVPDAGLSKFHFTPGKKHLLRLINTGSEGIQYFSIDGHNLTVVSQDFVPIKPYTVSMLALGIAQRYGVVVQANGAKNGAYYMRSEIQTACSGSNQPKALAIVYYPDADKNKLPTPNPQPTIPGDCGHSEPSLSQSVPYFAIKPKANPDKVLNLEIELNQNSTGYWHWEINNSTFRANYNSPDLLIAKAGNTTFPQEDNTYNTGNVTSVRIIVKNTTPASHPMHLHGHNMYLLAQVDGLSWDGTITNADNPSRRDVHIMPPTSTYVFQYDSTNPGVWPFHCHIAWHLSGGLYMQVLEQPDQIQKKMQIPDTLAQTCRDWAEFTGTTVVDEIDSGV